jgi:membrane fusion protein, copper/silver efflux system
MTIKRLLIIVLIVIMALLAIGYWWSKVADDTLAPQATPLYWVAPMNPGYRSDEPGKSPMGMDLVPVYTIDQLEPGTVKISPAVVQQLGVKTASVVREDLQLTISTVGYVTVDENRIEHIHTFTQGWIEKLLVKTTGEAVKQAQPLFELFSPDLVSAQEEYFIALDSQVTPLIQAAEKKLQTLGMTVTQIQTLKQSRRLQTRVTVHAPQNGIVAELNVREGMFVKPDTIVMTLEDLAEIWILAEVFERQAFLVEVGQTAEATLPYLPNQVWQGTVDYVYPKLDLATHTLLVRLRFPNPDETLKPNMYADVSIKTQTQENVLTVPTMAVIRTGEDDRVIISLGDGLFRAQTVVLGAATDDRVNIVSGVVEGDEVVVAGQFLIDSEADLKASFERFKTDDVLSIPRHHE